MIRKIVKLFRTESGFAVMSIGNTVGSILGAVLYLYFATIVSVDAYGQVNYVISFAIAAFTISSLGLDTTIMTFLPKIGRSILYECYSLVFISSIIASTIVGVVLRDLIAPLLILSVTSFSMSLVEFVTTSRYKEHALAAIVSRICQIFLSLGLFFLFGLEGFLLGYSIGYLVFGYRFFLGLKNFTLNFSELKHVWRFVAQVYGAGTSYSLLSYLDKIVVGFFFGYYVLGSYQLAFQVYTFLSIFPHTLFNYLLPHQARGSLKKRIKIAAFCLICVIVAMVVLIAPLALPNLFPKYTHVVISIQIMVFAIIPLTLVSYVRSNILAEGNRTMSMLYAGLISLTTEIISIIILGSFLGINGISSAILLTMTVEFIFLLIANKGHVF